MLASTSVAAGDMRGGDLELLCEESSPSLRRGSTSTSLLKHAPRWRCHFGSSLLRGAVVCILLALLGLAACFTPAGAGSASRITGAPHGLLLGKYQFDLFGDKGSSGGLQVWVEVEDPLKEYTDKLGGDPFTFRCPALPSSAGTYGPPGLNESLDACCTKYKETGWPYHFPQCPASSCESCERRSSDASFSESPLLKYATAAWAASLAVGSNKAEVEDPGFLSSTADWFNDVFDGADPSGVEHAEIAAKTMNASVSRGAVELNSNVNVCPAVGDWKEYVLNDDAKDIQARIFKSDSANIAVVVFRGTQVDSLQNWQVDADIQTVSVELPVRGGGSVSARIHEGFYNAAKRILPRVQKWVEGYAFNPFGGVDDDWVLLFAGHSLGGALATLAATIAEAEDWSRRPDGTVVFGSPRVADAALNQWWEDSHLCAKLLRINVYNDAVTWLPSRQVVGWMGAIAGFVNCLETFTSCLTGQDGTASDSGVDAAGGLPRVQWTPVCPSSALTIPGAMGGINGNQEDFSPIGGVMAHFLGNCLYGYSYGLVHDVTARDEVCGLVNITSCENQNT